MSDIKRVALAYSGGLDTSIIIPWLKERHPGAEVIAVCVDVGQDEDLSGLEEKALATGAQALRIVDARREFVEDYLFPVLRAGAVYEGTYLLGTSAARPLQAKIQVDIAREFEADAVAHGCTGKGNDQVRFELAYQALAPDLTVIAPWREWDIESREDAIAYAERHDVPISATLKKIYSRDGNIWHLSHEGGDLEDPANRPQEEMFQLTSSPQAAPDQEQIVTVDFEAGRPVGIDGARVDPVGLLEQLNSLGRTNGIGRADVVENRRVGMKSRGVYETPGGTILYHAIRELESLTLDGDLRQLKQTLAIQYADLVYGGKWFTPVRESIDAFMAEAASRVTGSVTVALYKGNVITCSRNSPYSLYDQDLASFASGDYDQSDAGGFITLFGLPSKVTAAARKRGEREKR